METSERVPRYQLFVCVDIAAVTATATWHAAGGPAIRPFTIEQSSQGFAALERRLRATKHAPARILVVMEATGSYWLSLATALAVYSIRDRFLTLGCPECQKITPDGVNGQDNTSHERLLSAKNLDEAF